MAKIYNVAEHHHLSPEAKPHDHVEDFQGDTIRIPRGGFVEMPNDQARRFYGQYYPQIKDGNGDLVDSKALKLVLDEDGAPQAQAFVSQIDGKDYHSKEALEAHYKEFQHLKFKSDVADDVLERLGETKQSAGRAAYRCPHQNCDFSTTTGQALITHMKSHDSKHASN